MHISRTCCILMWPWTGTTEENTKPKAFRLRSSLSVHLAWHNLIFNCTDCEKQERWFSLTGMPHFMGEKGISFISSLSSHALNSSSSCHQLGQGGKSVLPSILADCRTQVFFVFLSVLQNPPIKARQSLVFCGWNRKKYKKKFLNEQALWKGCGTDRNSCLFRVDSL